MSFSRNQVQRILMKAHIEKVIGKFIPLKEKGHGRGEYIALCPFHTERTPSFTVTTVKQFYHCFGCGAHGDAVGFLQQHGGYSRTDALITVAKWSKHHLPLGKTNLSRKKISDRAKRAKRVMYLQRRTRNIEEAKRLGITIKELMDRRSFSPPEDELAWL